MDSTIVLPSSLGESEEFLGLVSVIPAAVVALVVPSVALLVMDVVTEGISKKLLKTLAKVMLNFGPSTS